MTLNPWTKAIGPGGEGVYFSLGFRTMCGRDSLPPFHLEFWHTHGDDGFELAVLFGKGALTRNPVASQKPSSPDLLLQWVSKSNDTSRVSPLYQYYHQMRLYLQRLIAQPNKGQLHLIIYQSVYN
jgi:hypothetical protein